MLLDLRFGIFKLRWCEGRDETPGWVTHGQCLFRKGAAFRQRQANDCASLLSEGLLEVGEQIPPVVMNR